MKSLLVRRLWIVGALAGIVVISGAFRIAASPGHGQAHRLVAASSSAIALRQADAAEPRAVANEPAEEANEPAEEANEPAEEANEPADEVNEPAENDKEAPLAAAPPAPTAAPTSQPMTSSQTLSLVGGTVIVTCTGSAISLDSVTPNPGFTIDKEENEDGQVEVRLQSDSHESRLQVTCQNGTVVLEELREENS
jgi:cytoskeletal protein RodZ